MKNVSIIIPNYNGAELLRQNLPSVIDALSWYRDTHKAKTEIIITDDDSSDASEEVVRHIDKDIIYLSHKKNTGFSGNVNRGVKKATNDIVVLLNTDVSPGKRFLEPLLSHFEDNDSVFAVGCLDLSIEHGKEVKRGSGKGSFREGFLEHSAGDVSNTKTLWASGGSSAFSKKIWERLGGMCELYNPFYWEDIDLSYRAQKAGYTVLFEPKSVVTHAHDEGTIKSNFSKQTITSVAYRNQILFVWLTITDSRFIRSHLLWLPIHILRAIVSRNTTFLSGFLAAVGKLPQALRLRKRNRTVFTVTDADLLSL